MANVLLYYLIVINIVTFLVYGIDKAASKRGQSQCDTDDAPVFSKVWQQLEEKITDAEACAAIALYIL